MQSSIIRVVKSVIVGKIESPTWSIQTTLAFCFKLVLPLCFEIGSNTYWRTIKLNRICMHKILMNFTRWTRSKSRLV